MADLNRHYGIPAGMNRSYLDHELTLSGGGWSARPLPIKVILWYILGTLVILYCAAQTFISSAGVFGILLFIVWGFIALFFFGKYDKTKEMKIMQIPAAITYLPGSSRKVSTRRSSNPTPFYNITGMRDIHEDGLIEFGDGSYGRSFLVVGSASVLLFDEDKAAILDRVQAFWEKIQPDAEFIFLTMKEPQRIELQIVNMKQRMFNLQTKDPELMDLLDEQYAIQQDYVGKNFKSLHQYLVIKGDNKEAMRNALNVLQSEFENSSYMIKACTQLSGKETTEMMRVLYQGRPQFDAKKLQRTQGVPRNS